MTILYAILVLGVLGLVFGVLLGIAGKVFAVEQDPRKEEIVNALAGANCGACGYPGCQGYADAVLKGEAPVNACVPGGKETAAKVAEIMGVTAGEAARYVAFVRCAGNKDVTEDLYQYEGLKGCLAATKVPGSGSKACAFGCMGLGDCEKVCQFDAIHVENGVAKVDSSKCVGCKKCSETCPRKLIVMIPAEQTDMVACNSTSKGAEVRKACQVGCIGCMLCAKECPADAITITNNLAVIDPEKCVHCGHCSDICPRHIICDMR